MRAQAAMSLLVPLAFEECHWPLKNVHVREWLTDLLVGTRTALCTIETYLTHVIHSHLPTL
jgi:hypothetical protein